MSLNAATIAVLIAKGLTAEDLLEVARATEVKADPTNAERQASGPSERWGYAGPITPRLPDSEWWPLRNFILDRDGHTCAYCRADAGRMCADHIVPLSRGGTNDPDNLAAACVPCNLSKSDRLLSEWRGRGK